MNICALIPSYDHYRELPRIIEYLRTLQLAVFIIDDGSGTTAARAMADQHDPERGIHVLRLAQNSGKGGAVIAGMRAAVAQGYTHAVQIDADGQHDLEQLPALLEQARQQPRALISGRPCFDAGVPVMRRYGRWLTNVMVWCETLSLRIRDSMCGFRCYPLADCLMLADSEPLGSRMDFDTDIMVRLFWRGVTTVHLPVAVRYPPGNPSNFRLWRDNVRITRMHLRLLTGMLYRLPRFIRDRGWQAPTRASSHWARLQERGTARGLQLLLAAYRYGGRRTCLALLMPAVIYFYLSGREQRRASQAYLTRVAHLNGQPPPGRWQSLRHFFSFANAAVDKVAAWCGAIKTDQVRLVDGSHTLFKQIDHSQAVLLLVPHFGNIECIRAIANRARNFQVNVLIHRNNARLFNHALEQLAPDSQIKLIEVNDIGPDTALLLQEKIAAGEWIVIAADRVAIGARERSVTVNFLGSPAEFPQGPIILAHVLQCPVYMVAAWREGDLFQVAWQQLAERVELPRADREAAIQHYMNDYARWLEPLVLAQPLQWFNFYDFWADFHSAKEAGMTTDER
ncbi:putative LPLAT superfamily acyltransferase/GT2 family glycosyltransferase [Methylohalomonas lacus]|uniref:LPLAT superfamily acyltransferase/GT2 family glycosyltransferase n=1 Tax=Methylohalomonas lacus TaxID=398773 RepID=A0AAE3HK40_9GAMM|nr:glycosyltransferase family 2 protein [Methylohalomonas lacus]MCS3902362.1 putative LPLAT superfamily acyltransferase/GT2 family glycosyltransferase [Methylohalomonas lacus]